MGDEENIAKFAGNKIAKRKSASDMDRLRFAGCIPDSSETLAPAPTSSILRNPTKRASYPEMVIASRIAPPTTLRNDWVDSIRRWKLVPPSSRSLRLSAPSWIPTRRRSLRGDTSIDDSDEECTPMDPEELAALNSIINTRRSMATAHALAQKPVQCLSSNNPKEFLRTYSLPATLDNSASQPECSTSEQKLCNSSARHIRFAPFPPSIFEDCLDQEENESCSTDDEDPVNCVPVDSRSTQPLRRLSTGALNLRSSMERHRLSMDDEDRGRSLRSWRRSWNRSPARSQSPAPRSSEEKLRRRELIRAIRPGGTGMVTLLDGERIKASKVGDPNHEKLVDQNIQDQLWGFAALERARKLSLNASETPQNFNDQDSIPMDNEETNSLLCRLVSLPKLSDESGGERSGSCSATDADEVQRRYQSEVLALSAEVLSHVRKDRLLASKNSASDAQSSQKIGTSSQPAHSAASGGFSSTDSPSQGTHPKVVDRGGCHYLTVPDPSISMPLPLDTLPRRPDAIGIRVVPLSHLGRRPERPREGRIWASWELSDSDSDSEEQEARPMRATTRAAGQEVIQCRNTTRKIARSWSVPANANQATKSIPSFTNEMDEFWPAPSATRCIVAPGNAASLYRGLEKKAYRM